MRDSVYTLITLREPPAKEGNLVFLENKRVTNAYGCDA
jgi:hypothetical protein